MAFINSPIAFIPIPPVRSIGTINGYITVSENATDTLTITRQPVQQGASITDHAYMEPTQFSGQFMFNSSILNFFQSLSNIYQSLLLLQQSATPFTIVTPKRTYVNMLMTSLGVTTDKTTENILSVSVSCTQVILVSVGTTVVPASVLKNAAANQATQQGGTKNLNSIALNAVNSFVKLTSSGGQ